MWQGAGVVSEREGRWGLRLTTGQGLMVGGGRTCVWQGAGMASKAEMLVGVALGNRTKD